MNTVEITSAEDQEPRRLTIEPVVDFPPRSVSGTPVSKEPALDLTKLCSNLQTGSDLNSLLEVSQLLHQSRLKKSYGMSETMVMLNFQLPSATDEMSVSKPLTVRKGGMIDTTCVKDVMASCASAAEAPVNWFHVNTFHYDDTLKSSECPDLKALLEIGEALGITSGVIKNTMKNYNKGMICAESGPDCVGIAFVDLVRVDSMGQEVPPPKHLVRTQTTVVVKGQEHTETYQMGGEDEANSKVSHIKTIVQQPIAIFYSSKANTCLSVRTAPSGLETEMRHWGGIVKQLESKTSLVHKKMDAAYLMFLLIAEVINSIEPLLNTYGDALDGLDFLFDEFEPTVRRNMMSRRIQKDLWVIRRWGWQMSTTAQDLAVDPWDVFTDHQEKPLKMLLTQSNTLAETARAYIMKADSQEDFFSQTQEQTTNNLLFNLTIVTIGMLPPQFFTGVYGMNFVNKENGDPGIPELMHPYGYQILWGWCVHIPAPRPPPAQPPCIRHASRPHLTCLLLLNCPDAALASGCRSGSS